MSTRIDPEFVELHSCRRQSNSAKNKEHENTLLLGTLSEIRVASFEVYSAYCVRGYVY